MVSQAGGYPGFLGMKRLGEFASPSQGNGRTVGKVIGGGWGGGGGLCGCSQEFFPLIAYVCFFFRVKPSLELF